MRDYIFHGKRKDNGEWVEGYYVRRNDVHHIINFQLSLNVEGFRVIPESVGEWTGMCDKNGRKIFEGDIVRTQPYSDRPYSEKAKFKEHIGVVKHYVCHFKNSLYTQDYDAKWIVDIKDLGKYVYCDWNSFFKCEVIGNVFENADLLEG